MSVGAIIHNDALFSVLPDSISGSVDSESNLTDGIPKRQAQLAGSVQLTYSFSSVVALSAIAFVNASVPAGTTATLKHGVGFVNSLTLNLSSEEFKSSYTLFPEIECDQVRLDISVPATEVLSVGSIVAGELFNFPVNYKWNFKEKNDESMILTVSDGGQLYPELEYTRKVFELNFEGVLQPELYEAALSRSEPYKVFIPDTVKIRSFHGVFVENIDGTVSVHGTSFPLKFMENACE